MGSSKQVTVGYRYGMGLHMGICHEPDAMMEIRAGDRPAWRGLMSESGTIFINAPNLFGGDEREGGIQGTCDVMMGREDQAPNAYLAAQQGTPQPAYRGFLGLVYRGLLASNNPYIKAWAVRVRSILRGWHGGEAWYPERAPVYLEIRNTAIAIALDRSGSMNEMTGNGQTRMQNAKVAVGQVLDYIQARLSPGTRIDLHGVGWAENATTITRNNTNAAGVAAVKAFFSGMSSNGSQTDFARATASATAFFDGTPAGSRKVFIFITDGEPSREGFPFPMPEGDAEALCGEAAAALFATPGLQSFGFNIDLGETRWTAFLDNTPNDGVPVLDGSNPGALVEAVVGALGDRVGMNPAHIVYQSLTDPDWGMGYPAETIDQASFQAAADALSNEGMGLCLKWNTQATIQEFTQIVADHASLVYGQDRRTGKFRMRLLRMDYDEADLPVFTRHDVKVVRYQRPSLADTVNEVIIQFTNGETGDDATTSPLQNLANIQGQGRVVSQTLNFPGVTTMGLATRVGMRELQARSTPLWRFSIEAKRRFASLLPGEPFVLDLLDTDVGVRLVMRAGEIDYGETADAVVRAECVEDVFAMPETTYVGNPGEGGTPPDTQPRPAPAAVFEVPHVELAQRLPTAELAALPADAGYLGVVAGKPEGTAMNYGLHTRIPPADYAEAGTGDFAPTAVLTAPVGRNPEDDTTLAIGSLSNMATLAVGQAMFLGEGEDAELVRVDAIDLVGGTLEVGRACGDTVPSEWPAGTKLWGYDEAAAIDVQQYVDGETVHAKVTTRTPGGELALGAAPQLSLEMGSRNARPYPPGRFRINGQFYPEEIPGGDIVVSWAHRDRMLQADTLVDGAAASVGPEPGSSYTVEFFLGAGGSPVHTEAGITADSFTWTPPGEAEYRIELRSVMDGLDSWQKHVHTVVSGAALWTPAQLTNAPALWMNDTSPVTEVSGALSQVNDLSPNGFHATQTSAGARPTRVAGVLNGLPVFRFDGSNDTMFGPSSPAGAVNMLSGVSDAWSFIVYKSSTTNSAVRYPFGISEPGSVAYARYLLVSSTTNVGTFVNYPGIGGRSRISPRDGYSEVTSPTFVGLNWAIVGHRINFPGRIGGVKVNGASEHTATMPNMTAGVSQNLAQRPYYLGSDSSNYFGGDIAEILFGTGTLTTDDVAKIEGYLAWKWGLAASLPSGHPYKSAPPFLA